MPKAIFCRSAFAILFHFPLPLNEYQTPNAAVLNSDTLGGFVLFHLFQKDLANGTEELLDFDFHSQTFLPTGDHREGGFVGLSLPEMRILH